MNQKLCLGFAKTVNPITCQPAPRSTGNWSVQRPCQMRVKKPNDNVVGSSIIDDTCQSLYVTLSITTTCQGEAQIIVKIPEVCCTWQRRCLLELQQTAQKEILTEFECA